MFGGMDQIRDFIYSEDVALGMMKIVEMGYNKPVNLGSGEGVTIKEIAETIVNLMPDNVKLLGIPLNQVVMQKD